jgi:uncharacterized protein (TIGR03435 family)
VCKQLPEEDSAMQRNGDKSEMRRNTIFSRVVFLAMAALMLLSIGSATPSRAQSQSLPQAQGATSPAVTYEYEVASFKPAKPGSDGKIFMGISMPPDGFSATNATIMMLVQQAYGVQPFQILGAPDWFTTEHFDVNAKMDPSVADALQKLSVDDRRIARQQMMQALLADRLNLKIRRDTKELPVYNLVVGKNGPKLKESNPDDNAATTPSGAPPPIKLPPTSTGGGGGTTSVTVNRGGAGNFIMGGGPGGGMQTMSATAVPIATLVRMLSLRLGRTVLDKTGLTGKYDLKLEFAPDPGQGPAFGGGDGGGAPIAPPADPVGPSIFTAVQEQLGLKLESGKGPVETIIIEHAERPSQN